MRGLALVALSLLGTVAVAQERADTLRASVVSSVSGSLLTPQRITTERLGTVTGVSEAIRRFTGVQVRDYGGVGGLKTVNVRSLGSEHTAVFVDGVQVSHAQNMQVDLGRLSLEGLSSISLFSGQKTSPLQSAKEYSSASALYLESASPVFSGGRTDNLKASLGAGSFMTIAPGLSWEHLFKSGASFRISGDAVSSKGEYRFHVRDYKQYPDGTVAGYDTTMTRTNCDLASIRAEALLFSPRSGDASWTLRAYFYGSGRGLPGPVYKKAGEYPLSLDRQTDRDAFIQGRYYRSLGDIWSVAGRAKLSFNHLEYTDFPEFLPEGFPARYNYLDHSAYLSASAMARISGAFSLNLAQDVQYDYLDADLRDFAFPGRFSSWSSLSARAGAGSVEASATLLYLGVWDTFLTARSRSGAYRDALMPSLVVRWEAAEHLSFNGLAKRSYRMPTFNDLYYTTVGTKTLDPEDALQFGLGVEWDLVHSGSSDMDVKVDVYRNRLKNKIIAVPTSNQFRWSMYNLGGVEILGVDLSADYSVKMNRGECGAIVKYTFQQAKDRSDRDALTWGGQIPYIPVHSGSVNVFGDFSGWRADVTLFATGERFTTSANLPAYRLSPWTTLDAAVSKNLSLRGKDLTLKLCLNNLLNERYEIVDNYPMPGFNCLLSAMVSWR